MKQIINTILTKLLGLRLVNNVSYNNLFLEIKKTKVLGFVNSFSLSKNIQETLLKYIEKSKSGEQQDFFVLSILGLKRNGVFVEFGGLDGLRGSNTYLLEKEFDWKGLIVEPSKQYRNDLNLNRSCKIDFRCISDKNDEKIIFNEIPKSGLSTIDKYSSLDKHSYRRKKGNKYEVKTITLEKILDEYNLPKVIDYISIDTEGSEYDILKVFPFDKYQIKIITVEHNHNKTLKDDINNLLIKNNFEIVMGVFSDNEDWYLNKYLIEKT